MLRSGSASEVQGRDYWGSRCAGMCSENRWTQATEATKDLPHGLDQGGCAPVHKRTDSVQHDPLPNRPGRPRICEQRRSQAAATGRTLWSSEERERRKRAVAAG